MLFYIINLFVLIPKINLEADKNFKQKNYTKKFKLLHMYSVLFYLIQMILSVFILIKEITFNDDYVFHDLTTLNLMGIKKSHQNIKLLLPFDWFSMLY